MLAERISSELQIPVYFINKLSASASSLYRRFEINKSNGRKRVIYTPAGELMAIQRWLNRHMISSFDIHPAAMAYRKGLNIADNARRHASSKYILRLDLMSFFESIVESDISRFLELRRDAYNLSPGDIEFFTSIVCRNGRLTIGAPTSPALANAICFEMDVALNRLSIDNGCIYTRYADDLFFSTTKKNILLEVENKAIEIVEGLDLPSNLVVNTDKTRHSSKKRRCFVTGLVLTTDNSISVGRALKRKIKSLIFSYESISSDDRMYLAGILSHCRSVEPGFINNLYMKYGPERVDLALKGLRHLE